VPGGLDAAPGTRVIFVRHGHVHNPTGVIYGRMPRMRLSEQGRRDMERTACHLAAEQLAAIYTSPLLRARESAASIARYQPGVPVRRCSWLIEVRTSWQGELNKIQDEIEGFSYYDPVKSADDETILDVFSRMDRALRLAVRRHNGQTVVCVSHGDPIKILRIGYSGMELTPQRVRMPDPGQASMLTFHFWHSQALPIISPVDLGQMERIIAGDIRGGAERPGAPRRGEAAARPELVERHVVRQAHRERLASP